MKRSQIQTQIFVYILALIVISLILLYGYSAIRGFIHRSDEVNLVQFRTDFSNAIETQSHEYRSVIKKTVILPRGFNKMVLIDLDKPPNSSLDADYRILYDSWEGGVKENVFLLGNKDFESFFAGKIHFEPDQDHLIVTAPDRKLELRLTGMGGSTKVESWE